MAKNNQRDPNLRAATVARVNQLVKGGLTKASAFEKISTETGRAKDAVQMLYYRAVRANKGGQSAQKASTARKPAAAPSAKKAAVRSAARKGESRPAPARASSITRSGEFPALLNGIASAINNLLIHVEKTVEENTSLKEQAKRLQAITSLVRGH